MPCHIQELTWKLLRTNESFDFGIVYHDAFIFLDDALRKGSGSHEQHLIIFQLLRRENWIIHLILDYAEIPQTFLFHHALVNMLYIHWGRRPHTQVWISWCFHSPWPEAQTHEKLNICSGCLTLLQIWLSQPKQNPQLELLYNLTNQLTIVSGQGCGQGSYVLWSCSAATSH